MTISRGTLCRIELNVIPLSRMILIRMTVW
jgi:hypothetical protein